MFYLRRIGIQSPLSAPSWFFQQLKFAACPSAMGGGARGSPQNKQQTNTHTHEYMSNFNYHFVRKLYGATLTIDVSGINGHVDVVMHIGSTPCWSDGFLTSGNGCHWSGYKSSRVQALRFAQCAFVNMHGFSSSSAGNNPNKPARVHSPSEFRAFKRKAAKP